jgi:hypothetical protein
LPSIAGDYWNYLISKKRTLIKIIKFQQFLISEHNPLFFEKKGEFEIEIVGNQLARDAQRNLLETRRSKNISFEEFKNILNNQSKWKILLDRQK